MKPRPRISISFKPITRRELDERFADPELLEYKVTCYKCQKLPMECKCEDKWHRLFSFRTRIVTARINVVLGGGSNKDHKLTDRFGF